MRYAPAFAPWSALCAVLASGPIGFFQDPQSPRFRSGIELVEVDVIVRSRGKFVADVQADEFLLFENGEPRAIKLVSLVRGADRQRSDDLALSPSPAGTVLHSPPGQIFILFFDLEHLNHESFNRAKRAADRFLSELFPRDIVSIVADQPGFPNVLTLNKAVARHLLSTLRPKSNTLRSQLLQWPRLTDFEATRVSMGDERTYGEVLGRACEEQAAMCPEPAATLVRAKVTEFVSLSHAASARTSATLRSFAASAARLSGRKNLILLSDGFYVGDSTAFVQLTADLLARARIVVYGLDAMGLRRSFGNWADASVAGGPTLTAAMDDGDSGLQIAAVNTGGFVVRNRNDLRQALQAIRADASSYYVLAYEPNPKGPAQRKIEVKIKRGETDVRHRRWASIPGAEKSP